MARLARVVIPGAPHHVTQRGNRRERTFFEEADYKRYRTMLGEAARRAGAEVWAYCLMPGSRARRSPRSASSSLMFT